MKQLIDTWAAEIRAHVDDMESVTILLAATVLLALHRDIGSMNFAAITWQYPEWQASMYMFLTAFLFMGILPMCIVAFAFKEPLRDYGLRIGDWKKGLAMVAILFPVIGGLLLYPSSQTLEMKAFYPFYKGAGASAGAFAQFEFTRLALFYTAWEFFFRGFILFGLRKRFGDWTAICLQTLPSCLWHIGFPNGELFSSIPGGILFGIMALRTRSIVWPWALHVLIGITLDFFIIITR